MGERKERGDFSFLFSFFSFQTIKKAIAFFAFVLYDADNQQRRPSEKAIAFFAFRF